MKKTVGTHHRIAVISMIMIALGELLIFTGNATLGMAVHILNLQMIIVSMFIRAEETSRTVLDKQILQSLLLLLLLRIINVSMPFFFTMTLYWYPLIYSPMFISIYLILRYQNASFDDIGMHTWNLYRYIPLAIIIGAILAWIEYRIIHPEPLIPGLGIANMVTLVIIMFVFVGLVEELIFRSILQTKLQQSIGMCSGLLVASVLFGIMHSGYGSVYELMFATTAGLIIGYLYQKTGSLPFVTVIHGTTNVLLFGVLPHIL
jgi:membrane protease YdiL (CAAX protease family)